MMKKTPGVSVMLIVILGLIFVYSQNCKAQTLPKPAHIVIVVLENHGYTQIAGSTAAPYLNSLINDSSGAVFTQSYALSHPSQPNYIMLFSGANQGVTTDNVPTGLPFTTLNLGAALVQKGYTFTGYSEGLPSVGSTVATSGTYARKHAPWINWQGTSTNGIPTTSNQPFTAFPTNYSNLPTVSFVIPNMTNDMHDGSDPARITLADNWVKNNMQNYITWAKSNNSLLILTFDEDDNALANRILTVFCGAHVKKGSYSTNIDHYGVLRTIEDMYSLSHSGAAATASPINFCWNSLTKVENQNVVSGIIPITLHANYPNPFNPETRISFQVNSPSEYVTIKVFDMLGREMGVILNEVLNQGEHFVTFTAQKFATAALCSGVYYYRIQTKNYSTIGKMLLMQ